MEDEKGKNLSGKRIKEARQNLGMTQQDISVWLEEFGIHMDASAVTRIEKQQGVN